MNIECDPGPEKLDIPGSSTQINYIFIHIINCGLHKLLMKFY